MNTIFKGRKAKGEWDGMSTQNDLILGRILWLEGLQHHNQNTKSRYIYFHGTPQEPLIGQKASHGCLRLRSADLRWVFDWVQEGDQVYIQA